VGENPVSRGTLALSLKAVPENVKRARQAAAAAARKCGADAERVALATSEALMHVIRSDRRKGDAPEVRLEARREGNELVVTVSGGDAGFTPDATVPGLGAGMALIGFLASSIGFGRSETGVDLKMRFPCSDRAR
jgi:anti-sigma regulatory factor (Ser/Thr protein kinase)